MASSSFDPRLFRKVLLHLVGIVIIGIGTFCMTVGHPTVLDSVCIMLCIPLLAFIVHVAILEYRDWRAAGRD